MLDAGSTNGYAIRISHVQMPSSMGWDRSMAKSLAQVSVADVIENCKITLMFNISVL